MLAICNALTGASSVSGPLELGFFNQIKWNVSKVPRCNFQRRDVCYREGIVCVNTKYISWKESLFHLTGFTEN